MLLPRSFRGHCFPILLAGFAFPAVLAQDRPPAASYREMVLTIQQEIQANDLERARSQLSNAFKQYPADGGLENLLGIIEIQQGRVDRARQAFSLAIEHSPKLTSAYLNLARIYLQTAQTNSPDRQQVLRLYEKVLALDPGNTEANYEDAVLLSGDHKYEASLERIAKLDAETQKQVRVEAVVCEDQVGLGRKEAADHAVALMAANPDLTEQDALSVLPALRLAHRADLVDILFTSAGRRQPLSIAGLRILGLAQEAEGRPEEARATLERVFSMDSSQVAPLIDLTRIALAAKDYQGALGYLAHARTLAPRDPSLAYEFGVICLKLNLFGEAARAMGEAVKQAPDNPDYNFGMGTVCSFAQEPSQALPYLVKYHELRPSDPAGILALGTAYYRNKDFDNASAWLHKALSNAGSEADARYYLGRILREQGQYDQAIDQLTQSDKLRPDQPEVLAELGQVYLQMRNYPEAEKALDRAIALDPNNYVANFGLLQLYAHSHDPRRAEQSKRFDAIRGKNEEDYREAMRVIEIRPQSGPTVNP